MQIRFDRLQILADHLRNGKLFHGRFHFGIVHKKDTGCGSCGCAMGELPCVFPNNWAYQNPIDPPVSLDNKSHEFDRYDVDNFFELTGEMTDHLFYPGAQRRELFGGKTLYANSTKEEVADGIEAFIERMS